MHGFSRSLNSYAGSFVQLHSQLHCLQKSSFLLNGGITHQTKAFSVYNALRLRFARTSNPSRSKTTIYRKYAPEQRPGEECDLQQAHAAPPSIHEYDSLSQYDKGYWKVDQSDIAKRARPSPSVHLIHALNVIGNGDLMEPTLPDGRFDQRTRSRNWRESAPRSHSHMGAGRDRTISLQSITAKFIRWLPEISSKEISSGKNWEPVGKDTDTFWMFVQPGMLGMEPSSANNGPRYVGPPLSTDEVDFISRQGFTSQHLLLWAAILSERDIIYAARSLVTQKMQVSGIIFECETQIPLFVLNFLLRREVIPAEALRLLLTYTLKLLESRKKPLSHSLNDEQVLTLGQIDLSPIFLLFIRLLRHARKEWPPAIVSICTILTSYFLPSRTSESAIADSSLSTEERESSTRHIFAQRKYFTRHCNVALYLLSLPTSLNPMKSAIHQQRAQFDLIRKMVVQKPPIPVTKQGHRALTSVLLRLTKTPQEREWARLKTPSWPPFKQSRTRLDDLKGPEYGVSLAGRSLRYFQQYGYPLQEVDLAAKVLSGFHADGSPTIQTRAILLHRDGAGPRLWAAMIEATRTLPEAWACFLSYKESVQTPKCRVYQAMFEKLAFDRIRTTSQERSPLEGQEESRDEALPGDGRETFPAPTSPAEAIYIPVEPPTIESFFDQMIQDGVQPDLPTLTHLMQHAPTFEFGIKVWSINQGHHPPLLNSPALDSDATLTQAAQDANLPVLGKRALASFVRLLCTFPNANISVLQPITKQNPCKIKDWVFHSRHPFIYALLLTKLYKVSYRPTYNHLIDALTHQTTMANIGRWLSGKLNDSHYLASLVLVEETVSSMQQVGLDIDTFTFLRICEAAQNAAPAVRAIQLDSEERCLTNRWLSKLGARAEEHVTHYPRFLRSLFTKLVGVDSPKGRLNSLSGSTLPRFLAVPSPSGLHSFLRALGLFGDYEGIYSLVKWLVIAREDIRAAVEEELNGKIKLRRLIVGVRAMLEAPGCDHVYTTRENKMEIEPASEDLIVLVMEEIDSVEEWGGWASDEEIRKYFARK